VVLTGGEPGADLLAERIGEAVVRHVEQTPQRGAPVANCPVLRDAEGAEAGGAPIDADHGPFPYPSSEASNAALPPAAAVLMDTTRSSANRYSVIGPPAFGPEPERPRPPNGCTPTTAPIWLRLT
jgi:hypothetical protein